MFFSYIKLVGCNRTSLNGKREIVIRPTTKTQMVLGTNGGGKSSLIEIAFSPLPPDADDFMDKYGKIDGLLEQIVHHKGRTYHLTSRFGEKNSYSFIVDGGENLNRGRNVSIQRELVKEHFGYTKELHQFLTGKVKFTTMSPKQRQDWISRFSSSDFSYAFSLYNRWQKEYSGQKSIADYLTRQLSDARERLMAPEDVIALRAKADETHETLEALLKEARSQYEPLSDHHIHGMIEQTLGDIAKFIMTDYPTTENVGDLDKLIELRAESEMALHQLAGELKARGERLADCEHKKERLEQLGQYSPEELQASMDSLKAMLDAIPPQITEVHPSLLNNHHTVVQELRQVIGRLGSVRKTGHDVLEINNRLLEKKSVLYRYNGVVEDLDRQIKYIHQCENTECPSCKFVFKPGVEPGKLEELQTRYDKGAKLVWDLGAEIDHVEDELQDTSRIAHLFEELDQVRAKYQNVCPGLFQYLDTFGWTSLGRGLAEKLAIFTKDCERQVERNTKQAQYDTLKSRLDLVKAESGQTVQVIEDYQQALVEYNTLYDLHNRARARKARLDQGLITWQKYINLYEESEAAYERLRAEVIGYCNHQGNLMLDEMIRETKVTIGIQEAALSEHDTNLTIVEDLEKQVQKARIEQQARKALVDAMSPKTGLIAEQVSAQMAGIVGAVNQMIRRVWGYPLYISAGTPGDTEMDYNLPMTVDTQPRSDISKGSTSIKDIVDQAFRLTGYYCMNLTDYPLYLDELGSSFDAAHQHSLIPLIKDLVDDARFSQVLVISHQLDGQTAFPSSQTIILDDRNLNYPHTYNDHVEFA